MKILLVLSIIMCFVGCISKKYVYLQNNTNQELKIYQRVLYDIPSNDSLMKMILKKNNLYEYTKGNQLNMQYYKILKPDSLVFLDVVYGKISNTELIDSTRNYFTMELMITSPSDTLFIPRRKIIQKVNEAWAERNMNSSLKLKSNEQNTLIWKFENTIVTD